MVRLRIAELLEELEWTPYRLAKELGVTEPAVYRLVKRRGHFDRLSGTLLDRLCAVTGKSPGEQIEWSAGRRRSKA
jgi:plasmid maintenance system antidote protein VapI